MDQGLEREYFPELSKSLFISDNPEDKEEARRYFERAGLKLIYIGGRRYLGD